MTDQEKLYAASGESVAAIRALAEREGWAPAKKERLRDAVRARIINDMNDTVRATDASRIDPRPFLWRLDALRQAIN